ncbi:MAG: hypothetical protein JWR44_3525, partial [Hymenobacter sp.]|nr:hypothetical protein [Hymenobacter sp.]
MGVLEIFSTSLTYGSEFSYLNGLVVAPKVQARLHFYFFNASLAPILYTDFSTASLKLRPEMGIGNHRFDVNYGYNANLVNNDFTKLNRHMVSLRYYLMVRKRAHHTYDSEGVGIE